MICSFCFLALHKISENLVGIVFRQELLEQLKKLESLLGQVENKQAQMTDAEARVEALRRELTRAEIRAEEERSSVKKLFNQVLQSLPVPLINCLLSNISPFPCDFI